MPAGTRAQTKSRGPPGATGSSADSVESSTTADRPDNSLEGGVTDHRSQATNMSEVVPADISDPSIVLLRAKVMKARKDVDDCSDDVAEQVGLIKEKTAQGSVTPADALKRYKLALKNMIEKGDSKLDIFQTVNGELVEKLEVIILTAAGNSDIVSRTTSLRDKIVGESIQYRNRFIKLLAEHEALLDGVLGTGSGAVSTSVASLPPRVRKEYDFLRPNTIHSDCTKKELQKFAVDGKTWTSKTISEAEAKEEGIM